jgi:hypothetical protein
MILLNNNFPGTSAILNMKGLFEPFFVSLFLLFFFIDALSQTEDTLDLSKQSPAAGSNEYINYAKKGSYENDFYVGEVPEWHYYDMFGNKLLDGFYLYGMSMGRNSQGTGESTISLHPFLKKWFNGLLQVGDVTDKGGILAIIGEGIKNHFTPYSMNQSYFSGSRIDIFYDRFGGLNSASLIASRISNTGLFGGTLETPTTTTEGDWLLGLQLSKKYKDIFDIGGTYLNIHHEDGKMWHGNQMNGWDSDSLKTHTPTALKVYGFDGRCNLAKPELTLYTEYKRSQEILDGNFKSRAGNVGTLSGYWDFLDRARVGGEGYIVESRFKTTFYCPADTGGDVFGSRKYLYSLVEDNDDHDKYPENGASKLSPAIPKGDPDAVIPEKYDKNKNGVNDWEEDFLSYDCDPPKSRLYFDRNNNGVTDDIEDDDYPDYTYIPSFYLSGERYMRYDDMDHKTKEDTAGGDLGHLVSKGLLGFHLYGRYEIIPKLNLTLGGIAEKSLEKSYQNVYEDSSVVGQTYSPEMATTLYALVQYKKDFVADKNLTIQDYFRIVKDNIPNHTQTFVYDPNIGAGSNSVVEYKTVVDELDYRDAIVNMLIAQYSLFKSRGFNFTTRGKYEFTKHFPHLAYNYPDVNISSLVLLNKCEYIWLLPFLKDMYLIPKYKNVYEIMDYGPRVLSLDQKFRNNNMENIGDLVYEWKFTKKTAITLGVQGKLFNDFFDFKENYYTGNFSVQLLMQDRYFGMNIILTAGFSKYGYVFYNSPSNSFDHNPFNNPHHITGSISSYDLFLKVHSGF